MGYRGRGQEDSTVEQGLFRGAHPTAVTERGVPANNVRNSLGMPGRI